MIGGSKVEDRFSWTVGHTPETICYILHDQGKETCIRVYFYKNVAIDPPISIWWSTGKGWRPMQHGDEEAQTDVIAAKKRAILIYECLKTDRPGQG